MKSLCFVGAARDDLAAFPRNVRKRAGHELFMVQQGRVPTDFKHAPQVGSGVCEIRIRDSTGGFRVMYVATLPEAVYVLHAFRKKTQKTSRADVELARRRFARLKGAA